MARPSFLDRDFSDYDFQKNVAQMKLAMTTGSDYIPWTSQMSEFGLEYCQVPGQDFYSDAETFVKGHLHTCADFGFDTVDLMWDVYNIEVEMMGGEMTWFDDMAPAINNTNVLIKTEKDLAALKAPHPINSGRAQMVHDILHMYQEISGGLSAPVRFCAPFTAVSHMVGFERLIILIREDPEFVHKIFKYYVEEVSVPYLNELFKAFPNAKTIGSDAIGSLGFITYDILDEFSIPYILRMKELTGGDSSPVEVDSWWGDAFASDPKDFFERKLQVAPNHLKVQDPDLYKVGTVMSRDYATEHNLPLIFGVGNDICHEGSREDIYKVIHEYMEVGSSGPMGNKFALYLCSLSAQTPVENVRTIVEAINDFRKGDRPYEGLVESGERLWKDNSAKEVKGDTQVQGADLKPALDDNIRPLMDEIYEGILDYDNELVEELVGSAIEQDIEPDIILDNSLIRAMDTVGEEFATGELFVPEMLMAANAMKSGLEVLRPILTERKTKSKGTVVLATVQGDLHDIGKNLVAMLLEGGGFEVYDVGVNAAPDKIMAEASRVNADIVGLSALLTTSMPFMGKTVTAIKAAGNTYPVIVGGAPVSQDFADKIGADGYAESAVDAVVLAKRLMVAAEAAQVPA